MAGPMPLLALRAFAEVGRQGSVKAAAGVLGVTPGAVSQQVKALEARLGKALFKRGNRAIRLTPAGRRLLDPVLAGFDQIEAALEIFDAGGRRRRRQLRISTVASFAATWLVPRLGRFTLAHPRIDVTLHTAAELVAVGRGPGGVDIAIRHGLGVYLGLESVRLLQPRLVPVGSPGLLAAAPPIRVPADCLRLPLLQDADGMDWVLWLRALGVKDPEGRAALGPRLGDDHLPIRAAVSGQGLALVRDTYAADDVAAGRLAIVLEAPETTAFAYWFVTRPGAADHRPEVAAFKAWIMGEAALS